MWGHTHIHTYDVCCHCTILERIPSIATWWRKMSSNRPIWSRHISMEMSGNVWFEMCSRWAIVWFGHLLAEFRVIAIIVVNVRQQNNWNNSNERRKIMLVANRSTSTFAITVFHLNLVYPENAQIYSRNVINWTRLVKDDNKVYDDDVLAMMYALFICGPRT